MSKKDKKEIQFEQPSNILLLFDRYLIFIIAIIVVGILFSGYFFVLEPKILSISSTEDQTVASEERRVANESLLNKLQELEAEYQDILNNRQEDLSFLKKIIPNGSQIPELFLLADRLAKKHDFQLNDIDVETAKDSIKKELSNEASKEIETIDSLLASSGIKSIAVRLSVSRSIDEDSGILGVDIYNSFKDYLAELENNIRLLDIQSIDFGAIEAKFEGAATYTFGVDLITYYQ